MVAFCLASYDNSLSVFWVTGEPGAGWKWDWALYRYLLPVSSLSGEPNRDGVCCCEGGNTQTPSLVMIDIGLYYTLTGIMLWHVYKIVSYCRAQRAFLTVRMLIGCHPVCKEKGSCLSLCEVRVQLKMQESILVHRVLDKASRQASKRVTFQLKSPIWLQNEFCDKIQGPWIADTVWMQID